MKILLANWRYSAYQSAGDDVTIQHSSHLTVEAIYTPKIRKKNRVMTRESIRVNPTFKGTIE